MIIDLSDSSNHLNSSRESRDDGLSEVAEFSEDEEEDDIPLGKGTVLKITS